jgi:hypothetical protein
MGYAPVGYKPNRHGTEFNNGKMATFYHAPDKSPCASRLNAILRAVGGTTGKLDKFCFPLPLISPGV